MQSSNRRVLILAVFLPAMLAAVYVFRAPIRDGLITAVQWIDSLGFWGVFAFIGLYTTTTVLLIPGSIPTLAAGFVFGVLRGTIYVSLGSTIGATAAFFVGRYLARGWVQAQVSGNPRFSAIDESIGREGWKIVFLLRLSPLIPFSLSNYFYGVTRVKLLPYVLVSWAGMLPGTVMYVYIGSLLGELAQIGTGSGRSTGEWILFGVGLVATIVASVVAARVARRAIGRSVDERALQKNASPDSGAQLSATSDSRVAGEAPEA